MTHLLIDTHAAGRWRRAGAHAWKRIYRDGLIGVVVAHPTVTVWALLRDGEKVAWRTAGDPGKARQAADRAAGEVRA